MVVNNRWDALHYSWGHLLSPPDIKHFVDCVVTWSLRTCVWDHSDRSSNSVKITSADNAFVGLNGRCWHTREMGICIQLNMIQPEVAATIEWETPLAI